MHTVNKVHTGQELYFSFCQKDSNLLKNVNI